MRPTEVLADAFPHTSHTSDDAVVPSNAQRVAASSVGEGALSPAEKVENVDEEDGETIASLPLVLHDYFLDEEDDSNGAPHSFHRCRRPAPYASSKFLTASRLSVVPAWSLKGSTLEPSMVYCV